MEQDQAPQKRRGRPPKAVDRPKNASFTFRLLPGLREKLEASAAVRSVSMSEEIERRLEQSFREGVEPRIDAALRMAAANCMVVQDLTGETIASDPYTRAACAKAAATAIELVGGLAPEARDTPVDRAFLQAGGEQLGQITSMFTKALLDGAPEDSISGLKHIVEALVERRRAEIAESDRLHRQNLARLLREGASADPAPEPALRPATPDEIADTDEALSQLPPRIGDRAVLDETVAGVPLVKAERAPPPEPELRPTLVRRRAKAKA